MFVTMVIVLAALAALFLILLSAIKLASLLLAPAPMGTRRNWQGPLKVPHEKKRQYASSSGLSKALVEQWGKRPIPGWGKDHEIETPRIMAAKLLLGRDINKVNAVLANARPWDCGSTWPMHPRGDYDFSLVVLSMLLHMFGDQPKVLFPKTRQHMLGSLLTQEGGRPRTTAPMTFGLWAETENHILMTESSRYLKNRWMAEHGHRKPLYDNESNGLESWLLAYLKDIKDSGLYEFNSIPYQGYTITALLALEAFGSKKVGASARDILDRACWEYALGSLGFRRYPPIRRQLKMAKITDLDADHLTPFMKIWTSLLGEEGIPKPEHGMHHAFFACILPYRPPGKVLRWVRQKKSAYLIRIGHGPRASPEIYCGGPGYLLTAGGVNRGLGSWIVARPITLMLDDGGKDLSDLIYLAGPGNQFKGWNNTGVHHDLAVAAGLVHIPTGWHSDAKVGSWSAYKNKKGPIVIVYSKDRFGLVYLANKGEPKKVLAAVAKANGDATRLRTRFKHPDGHVIEYDLRAPKDTWVIKSVKGEKVNRDLDSWPLLDGNLKDT